MFDDDSRYADAEEKTVEDSRGRQVRVVSVPDAPEQSRAGVHRRRQGQRLDHLAHHYLGAATDYWKICEINGAMHPDQLAESAYIDIPKKES